MRIIHDNQHISDYYWNIHTPSEGNLVWDEEAGTYKYSGIGLELSMNSKLQRMAIYSRKRRSYLDKDDAVFETIERLLKRKGM